MILKYTKPKVSTGARYRNTQQYLILGEVTTKNAKLISIDAIRTSSARFSFFFFITATAITMTQTARDTMPSKNDALSTIPRS